MKRSIQNKQYDWPIIIKQWEESGLSKSAFCRRQAIPVSSLCTAIKNGNHISKEASEAKFAKVAKEVNQTSNFCECVIEGKNDICITIKKANLNFIRSLLSVV